MRLTAGRLLRDPRVVRIALVAAAFAVDMWIWGGDARAWDGRALPAWLIVVVAMIPYVVLASWRSPLPGYVAMWTLSLAGVLVPAMESFAGFLLALFLMARLATPRLAVAALVAAAAPVGANTLTDASFHDEDVAFFVLVSIGLWSLAVLAVWSAGRVLARGDSRLATERRWAEQARDEALAAERLRISRELHDIVAHSLTGIVLQAAGARTGLTRGTASAHDLDGALAGIQNTGEQSMRELHRLLGILRSDDDTLVRHDGVEQLGALVESARGAGLDVVLRVDGEPVGLDPSIAHTVYRVVQEGLSNAMKHAGAGARVEVICDWHPDRLTVSVRSAAGIGAPAAGPSGGFGLLGLRERVGVSGGTLEAGPTPLGYLLVARLPTIADATATKGEAS